MKELQQLGLIEKNGSEGFRVLARDYLRGPADPDIVRQLGVALHDHGATLAHNASPERAEPARFEGMASTPRLAPRYARVFAKFAEERGQAFLEEIDAWLVRHEVKGTDDKGADPGVRAGIGVYLIRDDARRGKRK